MNRQAAIDIVAVAVLFALLSAVAIFLRSL